MNKAQTTSGEPVRADRRKRYNPFISLKSNGEFDHDVYREAVRLCRGQALVKDTSLPRSFVSPD